MTISLKIYDTTLRDGTQREGISLSVEDKIKITHMLNADCGERVIWAQQYSHASGAFGARHRRQ
jgi:isopropylmalate/homocitrate/citramalate synthase